jgi:hypothetical protein
MPAKATRLKVDQLLAEYGGADNASITAYEYVIDELAELFDVSRQAAKVRSYHYQKRRCSTVKQTSN